MTEIEKLDAMLTELHVDHDLHRRFPEMDKDFSDKDWGWQVTVNDKNFGGNWDAICGYGSYGFKQGLLEVMGNIQGDNGVEGWLTAEQVMEMAKAADIWIAGVSVDTLAAYAETLLPNRGGIGRYYNDNFVHVDVRTARSCTRTCTAS